MVKRELDLKGEVCPYTYVRTKLALEDMSPGETLRVVVDHEPAITNIPRSAEAEGHEVLSVQKLDSTGWEIILKKG